MGPDGGLAPPGGGIDIDYCAFPTCPGNPRGIVSAPALCALLPPPPSSSSSSSHTFVTIPPSASGERPRYRDKEITAPADPLPGNRFQVIRFFAWASRLTHDEISLSFDHLQDDGVDHYVPSFLKRW